jgi:hypothetical protein
MKRFSLHRRVRKCIPKKFHQIDPRLEKLAGDKWPSIFGLFVSDEKRFYVNDTCIR